MLSFQPPPSRLTSPLGGPGRRPPQGFLFRHVFSSSDSKPDPRILGHKPEGSVMLSCPFTRLRESRLLRYTMLHGMVHSSICGIEAIWRHTAVSGRLAPTGTRLAEAAVRFWRTANGASSLHLGGPALQTRIMCANRVAGKSCMCCSPAASARANFCQRQSCWD